jgi:hypothetical protein
MTADYADDALLAQAIDAYIEHSSTVRLFGREVCAACEQPAPCPMLLWACAILDIPPPLPAAREPSR